MRDEGLPTRSVIELNIGEEELRLQEVEEEPTGPKSCHSGSPLATGCETRTQTSPMPLTQARSSGRRSSTGPTLCPEGVEGARELESGASAIFESRGSSMSRFMSRSGLSLCQAEASRCGNATTKSMDLMVGAKAQKELVNRKLQGAGELRWLGEGMGSPQVSGILCWRN